MTEESRAAWCQRRAVRLLGLQFPRHFSRVTGPVLSNIQACAVQITRSNRVNGCGHDHLHLPHLHCTAVSHLVATFTSSDQRQQGHAGVGSRRSLLRSSFGTSRAGDSRSSADCTTGSGVSGCNVIFLELARANHHTYGVLVDGCAPAIRRAGAASPPRIGSRRARSLSRRLGRGSSTAFALRSVTGTITSLP